MDKFWKMAIGVAGLGAIAFYVFNNLYEKIIALPIFAAMTSKQTFIIVLTIIILVFLALVIGLWAWVQRGGQKTRTPDSLNITIPHDSTFQNVAKVIAKEASSAIQLNGFLTSELNAVFPAQSISVDSSKRALELLGTLVNEKIRDYIVTESNGLIVLEVS